MAMKARHKRMGFLAVGVAALGVATWLVVNALGSNLSYFFSPTEVVEKKSPENHIFRLGGLVKPGSLERGQELTVRFVVTDNAHEVKVAYTGILPDLFDEGQGVIAQGKMTPDGTFVAEEVLAKHDENYMPPEVQEALAKSHAAGVSEMAEKELAATEQGGDSQGALVQ
jgi:cytochrome c-type biogenesis protein CcmE